LPKPQCEDCCEQEEEAARDLKPDDSTYAPEGTQESADPLAEVAAGLSCGIHGDSRRGVSVGVCTRSGCDGLGTKMRRACGGLHRTAKALAGNATGDANADAKSTADISGIHTVYDVSSGSRC
jgi:hypothetical protein